MASSTSPIASWIRVLHVPEPREQISKALSKNLIAVLERAHNLRALSLPQELLPSVLEMVSGA
jgi:hypothetical protein